MNMRLILNLLILSLVVTSFQSCVSKKKFDELQSEKDALSAQLGETEAKVAQLESQNADLQKTLESEKNRLNGEIASLRSDMDATKSQMAQVQEKLNMTEKELKALTEEINGMFASYSESGLSLEERDGRLFVVTEKVNYRSGSARLTSDERKALDAMAEKLKSNSNIKILVEGHTDNVPFKADIPMDNWDLSSARAMTIVRYLIKQGVSPSQCAAVARGESMPTASNDTAEGKAQNRRSVVLPDPNLGGLMKKN
jgi:chemotaxis protein MotB